MKQIFAIIWQKDGEWRTNSSPLFTFEVKHVLLNKMIDRLDLKPNSKKVEILDIGCGMTPVENATVILDKNKKIAKFFPERKFVSHNINKLPLPFKEQSFDYIYLNNVLHHLDINETDLMKEIYRILKVYGKVEIHDPNPYFIYHRLIYLLGIIPCNFILFHNKFFSYNSIWHTLRNAGFKIFELNNPRLFNPIKGLLYPHIKMIGKRGE